jgi:hypothetical protein
MTGPTRSGRSGRSWSTSTSGQPPQQPAPASRLHHDRTVRDPAADPEPASGVHAAAYQRLKAHLTYLKLTTDAEHLPEVLDQTRTHDLSPTATLEQLLALEVEQTEARRITGRLRFASLPTAATLEEIG